MKARPAIVYSVLRLLAFLVPFGLMMLLPIFHQFIWLAAIFAALIGLSLSVIFLRRPLAEATAGLPASGPRGAAHGAEDAASEDAIVDASADDRPAAPREQA
ncbi:DUF4229 domain-containing protein [Microbacterium sp. SORGH_AS_0888]|uniref:DUF4229 domain-containing protein n=1 Tax=Microbacterium sp. SORGH_AS_0888 TaxID=3041791 RepID=UPI00277E5A21|nr:DUF4229 domain-containing protein [Microbacterium sp. SORGH_AS_0888]MDQ1130657.1 hypothetical protein [Microbacterium sp. SORGH_AS_0888]